jgi:hypothetical protein
MQDVRLIHPETLEHVEPTNESQQRDILEELRKLESTTNDLKFQKIVTIANQVMIPKAHGCKSVKIFTDTALVYIDDVNGDVEASLVDLQEDVWLTLPINQVGNLRFLCATANVVIRLISCN